MQRVQQDGQIPDPRVAQITRLKNDIDKLKPDYPRRTRRSLKSQTSALRRYHAWPHSTKKSSGSGTPPTARTASSACR